ncbi:acetoacetate--CoA ligase [soil metagenome]
MSMPSTEVPDLLWSPPDDAWETTRLGRFARDIAETHGVSIDSYHDLWAWSVDNIDAFWEAIVEHFDVVFHTPPSQVRSGEQMPGFSWFTDATLNYAEHALRGDDDRTAIVARSHTRDDQQMTYGELRDQVARAAAGLRRLGVEHGDRVAAYLPNIPETIVAFLATASIGAIWSSCAPEFGVTSVIDRLEQIAPKVLLTIDGYRYGDRAIDRSDEVAAIRDALPALEHTVLLGYLDPDAGTIPDVTTWQELTVEPADPTFEPVAFDHPLYILFSSGTTGMPKAIVHGHGGITIEHLKMLGLHHALTPDDPFFWFTTTGWMMWNLLVSGLLVGTTVVLFDGDPGHPDLDTLWQLVEDTGISLFGVSAPFLMGCRKQGMTPGTDFDLSALRQIGSTGAPLPPEGFEWVYEDVKTDVLLASVSGGTDMCTAFVGASPVTPVYSGEISCRCLGARVEAYDQNGHPVIGERGELVITAPMPSMPVGFWGDDDGSRYHDAYFDTFPGVWRHGDWIRITDRGTCVITGRSDATLNRGGVRMGTSEFYRSVEDLDEVTNALVIHLEDDDGGSGTLLLFVVLADGHELDDALRSTIADRIRSDLSPRHIPDELHAVPDVPRTLSGKKLEVPVKRLFAGADLDDVASEGALANPESLDAFQRLAERDRQGS